MSYIMALYHTDRAPFLFKNTGSYSFLTAFFTQPMCKLTNKRVPLLECLLQVSKLM